MHPTLVRLLKTKTTSCCTFLVVTRVNDPTIQGHELRLEGVQLLTGTHVEAT